ncbi:MAG: HAMP domain-containing sensor histidine kinase [Albidovulum sp.]
MKNLAAVSRWLVPLRRILASFSMRLAAAVSIFFAISTILAGGIAYWMQTSELRSRLEDEARQMVASLVHTYETGGQAELQEQITTNIASSHASDNLYLFVPEKGQGAYGNAMVSQPFTGTRDIVAGVDITLNGDDDTSDGEKYLAYGIKIPDGWIICARDTKWITDSQEVMLQSIAWGLGLSLFLSIGLALVLAYRSESRIMRLSHVLDGAASGDLTLRFVDPSGSHDDISRVALLVNEMLDRLSQSMNSLRQVSTDVAHDLRSPLTRLRTRLEPHVVSTLLPDETQADLQKALSDLDAIVSTFDAVLRLARIEGGNASRDIEEVNLGQLVDTMHEMLHPVAVDMGHTLSVVSPVEPLLILGDRQMLSQAIVNLIENAFRHCPAPAEICVKTWGDKGNAHLSICDNGPSIPAEQRDLVLGRFYRLENSRNTPGSGLGLSLVAAIVRLHNGSLSLTDADPGLCVEVQMPLK